MSQRNTAIHTDPNHNQPQNYDSYNKDRKGKPHLHRLLKRSGITLLALIIFYHSTANLSNSIKNQENHHVTRLNPQNRKGPFPMAIEGNDNKYRIFEPFYEMEPSQMNPPLFASPLTFLDTFESRISWVDTMVSKNNNADPTNGGTPRDHAVYMYLEMIKSLVSATAFNDAEMSIRPALSKDKNNAGPFNMDKRKVGGDWTYSGDTMVGWERLDNIRELIKDVVKHNVKGDYIETGVWRGGASVFARAAWRVLDQNTNTARISYVCDSFRGLPPGDKNLISGDRGWDNTKYLEVPDEIVANNFQKYGLLDENVVFAKGFFNETMPPLSKHIKELAIMRLDGDMYESTVDVLYHLYDKLAIGGYVIMDDWYGFPSKVACEDFFEVHGIEPEVKGIDNLAAYWQKTEQVKIQYWRYEQSKFRKGDVKEKE